MIKEIKSYRDLEVWKKGVLLSMELYKITNDFPPHELFGISSQIRRAAASVPANIAEGYGRESTKNYLQFLRTARGSLNELDTFLTIATGLEYLTIEKRKNLHQKTEEISKMLNSLIKKLNSKKP